MSGNATQHDAPGAHERTRKAERQQDESCRWTPRAGSTSDESPDREGDQSHDEGNGRSFGEPPHLEQCGNHRGDQRHPCQHDASHRSGRASGPARQGRQQEPQGESKQEALHLNQPVGEARVGGRHTRPIRDPMPDAAPPEHDAERKEEPERLLAPDAGRHLAHESSDATIIMTTGQPELLGSWSWSCSVSSINRRSRSATRCSRSPTRVCAGTCSRWRTCCSMPAARRSSSFCSVVRRASRSFTTFCTVLVMSRRTTLTSAVNSARARRAKQA